MVCIRILLLSSLAVSFTAASVLPRIAPGTQFITGVCASDADCASGCCSKSTNGKCAARLVAEEGLGCGFIAGGETTPAATSIAVVTSTPAIIAASAPASTGTQFITGVCSSDNDCASGCCSKSTPGKCAARLVAEEGLGCGFVAGTSPATASAAPESVTASAVAPAGTQFITGVCASDADCASGCCSKSTNGKCAARLVAEEGLGCGFVAGVSARQLHDGDGFAVAPTTIPNLHDGDGFAVAPTTIPNLHDGDGFEVAPTIIPNLHDGDGFEVAPTTIPDLHDGDGFAIGNPGVAPAVAAAFAAAVAPASVVARAPAPAGTQFITGVCASDADCASGCCSKSTNGKCAARLVAEEGLGCGFVAGTSPATVSVAPVVAAPPSVAASAPAATGTQFITGACASDADCASGCCSKSTNGKCAARLVAEEGLGCGFVAGGATSPASSSPVAPAPASTPAASISSSSFALSNGQAAQKLNGQFATLTAASSCTEGQQACVAGGFSQCVGGKFVTSGCAAGTQCFALPLVNSAGTSITCSTEADATSRIANTGATGGLTGSATKRDFAGCGSGFDGLLCEGLTKLFGQSVHKRVARAAELV